MKIKGHNLFDLAKEFIDISYQSLKDYGEECYLEPIKDLIDSKMTPSDVIIKNWQGAWGKDVSKLVEYSILK